MRRFFGSAARPVRRNRRANVTGVMMRHIPALLMLLAASSPAMAYIGPGAGLGAIALTVGLVLGVALLLVGFLWYPLKRMMRKTKTDKTGAQDS